MSTRQLAEAILDGGIRTNNFFNGRLLSGEDLTGEQAAQREGRRRLGLALGDGVAFGLEVAPTPGVNSTTMPGITVTSGLAVNRQGQSLFLSNDVDVSLVRPTNPQATPLAGFGECEPPQTGVYIAGVGAYLLTIAPTLGSEGRAPVSGLGNVAATCNTRYNVEGIQFRLIQIDLSLEELDDPDHLRNTLAYHCFGVADLQLALSDPFLPPGGYGALDVLRATGRLTDCDVPLAVLYWTADRGIEFIDHWSVRRRLAPPPADDHWLLLLGDRRLREAEAMFLQFEDQVEDILANEQNQVASLAATDRFAYLPPVGLLPLAGSSTIAGFDALTFFGARASQDVATMDASLLRSLLHEGLYHEPIDLGASDPIQLYLIWENVQAVAAAQAGAQLPPQLTLVFASHTLAYRGVARFGSASWGLSRFASRVI